MHLNYYYLNDDNDNDDLVQLLWKHLVKKHENMLFSMRIANLTNNKQTNKWCSKHNSTSSNIMLLNRISIAVQMCLGANVCLTTCIKDSKMSCWPWTLCSSLFHSHTDKNMTERMKRTEEGGIRKKWLLMNSVNVNRGWLSHCRFYYIKE